MVKCFKRKKLSSTPHTHLIPAKLSDSHFHDTNVRENASHTGEIAALADLLKTIILSLMVYFLTV